LVKALGGVALWAEEDGDILVVFIGAKPSLTFTGTSRLGTALQSDQNHATRISRPDDIRVSTRGGVELGRGHGNAANTSAPSLPPP
jgi:hypothetical protein